MKFPSLQYHLERQNAVMKRVLIGAYILVISLLTFMPHSVLAAEHCNIKVESVDEDRAFFTARPIWTSSLFTVTMITKDQLPSDASIRVYTLGGSYGANLNHLRWFPTDTTAVYRSAPLEIAFPHDETFLHVGVTGMYDSSGFHDCVPRLFGAFAAAPRLTLAPLRRQDGVVMQSLHPHAKKDTQASRCDEKPARIAAHVPMTISPPGSAPTQGGPYISLIAVHVAKTGEIKKTNVEVSSGLAWLDEQSESSARQQTYSPASADCRPAPGLYYYAGRFDTPREDDLTHAF